MPIEIQLSRHPDQSPFVYLPVIIVVNGAFCGVYMLIGLGLRGLGASLPVVIAGGLIGAAPVIVAWRFWERRIKRRRRGQLMGALRIFDDAVELEDRRGNRHRCPRRALRIVKLGYDIGGEGGDGTMVLGLRGPGLPRRLHIGTEPRGPWSTTDVSVTRPPSYFVDPASWEILLDALAVRL
jgi:hypothetical protein